MSKISVYQTILIVLTSLATIVTRLTSSLVYKCHQVPTIPSPIIPIAFRDPHSMVAYSTRISDLQRKATTEVFKDARTSSHKFISDSYMFAKDNYIIESLDSPNVCR